MPWQNISQQQAETAATATPLPAVAAPDPLPAQGGGSDLERIVAVEFAMSI
jgi:hypothetical protein